MNRGTEFLSGRSSTRAVVRQVVSRKEVLRCNACLHLFSSKSPPPAPKKATADDCSHFFGRIFCLAPQSMNAELPFSPTTLIIVGYRLGRD